MSLRNSSMKFHSPHKDHKDYHANCIPSGSKLPKINGGLANSKGFASSNAFNQHLKNARTKADENIEDEYIKNLQQQIAYQELELKLLKEKELEQKQSVGQIEKFFNDGIPLNENILALKNQYNHQKKTAENRIDELNENRMDEMKLAADLKNNYERSVAALKAIMDALDKKEKNFTEDMNATRMSYLEERNRRSGAEKELKELQKELKKLHDHNLQMTRDLEKENVLMQYKDESLKAARKKTKDEIHTKEELILKIGKEVQEKRLAATDNPEIIFLTNENMDLSSKVIRTDKEANMARAKVKEMEMFLDARKRERMLEAEQKRELITKINSLKFQIDEQNKMNEGEIKKRVADKEDGEKKDLEKEIQDVKNQKTITKTRIQEKEDGLRDLASQKMGVQQDIMALEVEMSHLDKEVKEKSEILLKLQTQDEGLKDQEVELDEKLVPIVKEINKSNVLIPQLTKHNEELKERIAHEEKKIELSSLFKNINLEELVLLVQSNDQVQGTISDLMRKWDMLLRLNMEQQQNAQDVPRK